MKTMSSLGLMLLATSLVTPAQAQQPETAGSTVVLSEPGRAQVVRQAEISANVVAIDQGGCNRR